MVVLVWVYYSAQIFLLGAEFTWVYAHAFGSRLGHKEAPRADVPARTEQAEAAAAVQGAGGLGAAARGAGGLDGGFDPGDDLRLGQCAGLPADLATATQQDQRRNAADGKAR